MILVAGKQLQLLQSHTHALMDAREEAMQELAHTKTLLAQADYRSLELQVVSLCNQSAQHARLMPSYVDPCGWAELVQCLRSRSDDLPTKMHPLTGHMAYIRLEIAMWVGDTPTIWLQYILFSIQLSREARSGFKFTLARVCAKLW